MEKNIKKLFYFPIIFLFLISFVYFWVFHIVIKNEIKKEVKNIQEVVIKQKKNELKKDMDNFKYLFSLIKHSIYATSLEEMNEFLKVAIMHNINKIIETDNMILGYVGNRHFNYSILDNKYIILNYKHNKYLVFLKNKGKKVYLIGIKKRFIDDIVLDEIKNYLNKINKNQPSYIAMGKITTFNPDKNGIFGYVYYMPNKFKHLEGKQLSINKPDIKGNYFRKKYLMCLKDNPEGCFVEYYFKNPKTSKIEQKISYISLIKDYNLDVLKGIYKSQINNLIQAKGDIYDKEFSKLFKLSLIVFFIIYIFLMYIVYIELNKIKLTLLEEYDELKTQLEGKYYYDNMTGLPNRIKLKEDFKDKEIHQLVIIDIKDFGILNELYGFEFGDKILIKFADKLKDKFEMVYKYGNDEFVLAFKDGIDNLITKIKLILKDISDELDIKVEINIGVSNIKPLIETAEMALYKAKKENKFFVVYNDELKEKEKEKYEKIQKLKEVLEKKDIVPFYQCIVDKTGKVVKYEALMRIKMDNEIYSPYFFMDLIKESKLYDSFSKIMIEKVFNDLKYFDKAVSVNLSYNDIKNENMISFLLKKLDEAEKNRLIFEILESEGIENYNKVNEFLNLVKQKGVLIAIDDFGSGYSNFVNILKLKPDFLKIDASLIKNITDKKNYKLVKLMNDFAKEFNFSTVAEFVSNKEIFEKLKEIGINEYQGFYFCEPEPLENIIKKDKISSKKGENENSNENS